MRCHRFESGSAFLEGAHGLTVHVPVLAPAIDTREGKSRALYMPHPRTPPPLSAIHIKQVYFAPNESRVDGGIASFVFLAPAFVQGNVSVPEGYNGSPWGLAIDPELGDLYVSDWLYDRVLVFQGQAVPTADGPTATAVLGQYNFTTVSSSVLHSPTGIVFDPASRSLWVADSVNSRLARFAGPFLSSADLPGLDVRVSFLGVPPAPVAVMFPLGALAFSSSPLPCWLPG